MSWIDSEQAGCEWFKETYDSEATWVGKSDSTVSDVFSPKFNCYIEVKQYPSVACGQFTEGTGDKFPICQQILDGDISEQTAREYSKLHYKAKNVGYFVIIKDGTPYFYNFEDFFNSYTFKWDIRPKWSGSNPLPQRDAEAVLAALPEGCTAVKEGKQYFVHDKKWHGEYIIVNDNVYIISKSKNCPGRINKRGSTKNMTYHVQFK
ncbi:MAG: hypothetical protein J6W64_09775 [Bacilli bacterium]|nr:hypothetical protein [Bacilli bacterium]MBO7504703.1 hypothetical protein [bacterium]